jgi:predicted RNase H-like HicB family nuclease
MAGHRIGQQHGRKGTAMRYAVLIEKGAKGFGAYVPDLPGCIAAAKTRDEVVKLIQDAMEFHIEGLKQGGEPVPKPTSSVEFVEVAA